MPVAHLGHWYPVEFSLIVVTVHPSKHHHTAILLLTVERRKRVLLEESNTTRYLRVVLIHPSEALLQNPF